jgi:hypothetical protein
VSVRINVLSNSAGIESAKESPSGHQFSFGPEGITMAPDLGTAPKKRRMQYTLAVKMEAVEMLQTRGYEKVSLLLDIPIKTLEPWPRFLAENVGSLPKNQQRAFRKQGAGRPCILPDREVLYILLYPRGGFTCNAGF